VCTAVIFLVMEIHKYWSSSRACVCTGCQSARNNENNGKRRGDDGSRVDGCGVGNLEFLCFFVGRVIGGGN
jgi:hypothetical protein